MEKGKYLKPYQHYADLYDRHTVELCRGFERPDNDENTSLPEEQGITKEQALGVRKWAREMLIHFETGERYLQRESKIKEWMDRDSARDDLYENAQPPEDIRCLTCRNRLTADFKQLWTETDKPDRVLFMFECPNHCLPRRVFFSDGEEWRTKPILCLHCNTPLESKRDESTEKVTAIRSCPKCDYSETEDFDLTPSKQEDGFDENFAKDRDRFCLTDEEGQKFREEKFNMQQVAKFMDEWKEKEKAREEKLKQNPGGYHLEGAGYTCAVCHNHTPEGDNWYDEYGIKCLVCQKAIDNGEIPASVAKNKDSWYTRYELERAFNIKAPTLRKWVKEGIIKARQVSHYGNGVHYEFYMIEDNKDFLPPKDMVKSRSVKERKDGKDYHTSYEWYRFVDPFVHLKGYKIMDYMRIVPEEEMKAREEAKKAKKR